MLFLKNTFIYGHLKLILIKIFALKMIPWGKEEAPEAQINTMATLNKKIMICLLYFNKTKAYYKFYIDIYSVLNLIHLSF